MEALVDFAFMLLLGTVISIFTAVFATRAFLSLLAGFRWFDNPKFMGAEQQKMARWQMFDAVGKRRIWFTIAGVLIALSVGADLQGAEPGDRLPRRHRDRVRLQQPTVTPEGKTRRDARPRRAGRNRPGTR